MAQIFDGLFLPLVALRLQIDMLQKIGSSVAMKKYFYENLLAKNLNSMSFQSKSVAMISME